MIVQDELNTECGIGEKDARRQAALSAGKHDRALQHEIEEQRVELVDFPKGISFGFRDVAIFHQRPCSNKNVDRRQWIVAAVNETLVQILALENRRQRFA